ncbi:MAG: hypothetical protein NVSMB56_02630 [Pyrinomonadaceae bacterium]
MNRTSVQAANTELSGWLYAVLAWAMPGGGHLWQGRIARGVLMGGSVWAMFVCGILLGGHLYAPSNSQDIGALAYFFSFFDIGNGLLYLISILTNVGTTEQAKLATADYGNLFLMIAGLLNYLNALDAFDIGARRKN